MPSTTKPPSPSRTARSKPTPLVRQFSIFLENKCGRLFELTRLFNRTNIHILGVSVVDTTDSAVVRVVVDDPDKTAELFHQNHISFSDTEIIVAELPHGPGGLGAILTALLEAEINIYYLYSLIVHSNNRAVLAFHVEDHELATEVLKCHGFTTLNQADLSR